MSYPVGDVARLSGTTVRTLHHYDAINLLTPSDRSAAGYRRYTEADLERLRHILAYRTLGFPLDAIAAMLDDPDTDHVRHLQRQRRLLTKQLAQTQRMIAALNIMMEAHTMGYALTPEERQEVWGSFNPEDHEAEVIERWGDTDAYAQSAARTRNYTKADWLKIRAEADANSAAFAAAMAAGIPATDPAAMDLAEAHRQHITRWFYDCGFDIHQGLGQMFVDDPRFTQNIEADAPGLAAYIRDAILANAARHGA